MEIPLDKDGYGIGVLEVYPLWTNNGPKGVSNGWDVWVSGSGHEWETPDYGGRGLGLT